VTAACGPRSPERAAPSAFDGTVDDFFQTRYDFYPTVAAEEGLHEYDGKLGIRSVEAIEAYTSKLHALEGRFSGMDPAELSTDQRLDRDLVLRAVRGDLFWLEDVGTWKKNPALYQSEFDFSMLLLRNYAPLAQRMRAIVSRLEQFPALVEAARANVSDPPRPFVESALVGYRNWPSFLEGDLTDALASVEDSALQAEFRSARDAAAASIRKYAAYLEDEVLPNADGEFALGPERYHRMNSLLASVDLPTERLEEIAQGELERITALGDSLAEIVAPGRGIEAALDALGSDSPKPGTIVGTAADVIGELKSFTARVGTVLPGDVQVREIPPFARTNFAYIMIPGPYEKVKTGYYFIQPLETSWSPAVQRDFLTKNNRWMILNTSAHEAYPGHYQHWNHIERAPTKAQQLLTAYVTTEGWAHYGEEMSWRQGLEGSNPRLGLAVVRDALLRVVRFQSSIGLHTKGMSVAEAEQLFRTRAHQDSVNAHQQALRGTRDPEYLNYTLGKLMIRQLRGDVEKARGAAFDLRAFHDEFMAHGAPPVPWIARRMLDDPEWKPFE